MTNRVSPTRVFSTEKFEVLLEKGINFSESRLPIGSLLKMRVWRELGTYMNSHGNESDITERRLLLPLHTALLGSIPLSTRHRKCLKRSNNKYLK